MRHTVVSS